MLVALPGDYGKPRPAVVVQHDAFEALPSVTLVPLTSTVRDLPLLRITVPPGPSTGLRSPSQLQVDKISTVGRSRVRGPIGALEPETLATLDAAIRRFIGLS